MIENRTETPSEYFSARSRTPSIRSQLSDQGALYLQPLDENEKFGNIRVSNNPKREFKDKKIYVNARTGLPVRPPTSFGLFKHTMRRNIKQGKVDFHDFNKRSNMEWSKMSDKEKEPYVERAKMLADQFKKIEVACLRKKVRQLQSQIKLYRQEYSRAR